MRGMCLICNIIHKKLRWEAKDFLLACIGVCEEQGGSQDSSSKGAKTKNYIYAFNFFKSKKFNYYTIQI